jgi:hypothetical protein
MNGDFEQSSPGWPAPWSLFSSAAITAAVDFDAGTAVGGAGSARIVVTRAAPGISWDLSLSQQGVTLIAGTTYTLTFYAKSTAGLPIMAAVQETVDPWTARAKQWFTLTSAWQQYVMTYTAPVTESTIKVQFNLAQSVGTLWLDNVSLVATSEQSTSTSTPVPPTATATPPAPTATNTALPATATGTPVPPTATYTAVPPSSTPTMVLPTATSTSAPPSATRTGVPPTATSTATPVANPPVSRGGSVQDYPRLADINAFKYSWQAGTFSRYGLIVAPMESGWSRPSAVSTLKKQNPKSKILFYLNSSSVNVPGFHNLNIYPGWWLTLAGTTLSTSINAVTTTIPVRNASIINNYISTNSDLLVDGESMHVTAVNLSANTITVQRGYNSIAAPHNAGARIAAHADKWAGSWMLNVTPYCPKNPANGETWAQYAAYEVWSQTTTYGWDGVFFDDANTSFEQVSNGQIDANNDNVADGGEGPSGTGWRDGEAELLGMARSQAPRALLLSNGGYYPGLSDGREMEHFPVYDSGWSNAFTTYMRMAGQGAANPTTIIDADTDNTGTQDLRTMRFNLATALMGDGYYAYDYGTESHGQTWWYDEYDGGQGSSLVTAIDGTQTTLPLAAGTGKRFRVGDIVRVPESSADNSLRGAVDDEQMLVTGVSGDTLTVQRRYNGSLAGEHPALSKVLTAAQITSGQGWLGQPLGPAVSAASGEVWLAGASPRQGDSHLWRRDFQHGTVLLNGTASPQTVTLSPGYRRIAGTQDPVTNNGTAVSSVTLPPNDALLLVKVD